MKEPARTCLEALVVGAVALGAGLVANELNRDGLSLTRDHFRTSTPARPDLPGPAPTATPGHEAAAGHEAAPGSTSTESGESVAAVAGADAAVAERLRERGLKVVTHEEARELFEDPAFAAGAYVFVDARGDDAYRAGHVPGAVQFDRYHLDRHVEAVQAACAGALKVIVYCIGVNCEDSEMAAQDLPAFGIDPNAVYVYVGGWTAWSAAGLPVEKGARGGGDG